ncbi:MAG TPA: hypothetical protein VK826_07345 [Bacteroidia bacterium]|nr:hypothetical protein [Bacteroidia bacterium]
MNRILIFLLIGITFSCQTAKEKQSNVVTTDIDNFWAAYDLAIQEPDSLKQIKLIDSLYIQKGTLGLQKIMEAKNYTAQEYVELINKYPKYWNSIRKNTYKSKNLAAELNEGIEKLRSIYPQLRPAKIYFTIGAMRTNGTTRDSSVLIGSELAMADSSTDISEFEGETKEWLKTFFDSDPIDGLVLLNVHEYIHTQQSPIPNNLLHTVLYEGIAEFVSVKALGVPSNAPAIEFGKSNPAVRDKFEREMFYEWTFDWLWSNSPNEFGVRDLGYYVGYAIAERHYEKSSDKQKAIKELIELNYGDPEMIDVFIDQTEFFSKPIEVLRQKDQEERPRVTRIKQFENRSLNVFAGTQEITIEFSEKLNGYNTGVDYGESGEDAFPEVTNRFWSKDSTAWTIQVKLEPQKRYQFWITNNFRTADNIPILPYLIEFQTGEK